MACLARRLVWEAVVAAVPAAQATRLPLQMRPLSSMKRNLSGRFIGPSARARTGGTCTTQDDKRFATLKVIRNRRCSFAMPSETSAHHELPDRAALPQHECGLFGVFGHPNAAVLTYYGLFALQHRGQESAGIVTSNGAGQTFLQHKGMRLVSQVFGQARLEKLKGTRAVGHTRYSTTGTSTLKNAQPFVVDCVRGQMAIAHNGNLINADLLRDELESKGSIFQTTADSEIILHLLARRADNGSR